jgi:Asp-tRNA(Asn)/Glu-tRNA(Gln) amidotransferase A subunit family amidase
MRTPRLSGYALASIARLARSGAGKVALRGMMRRDLKVGELAALPDALRGDVPLDTRALQARPPRRGEGGTGEDPRPPEESELPPAWAGTSESFTRAYRERATTPREVVERALDAARELAARTPSVGPLLDVATAAALEAADEATARWKAGKARGSMDGVPFAVKEQTAVRGLPRRSGAPYSDPSPQREDATCIARLRALGAIPIGTTPMTEWGMTPLGCNAHRTMPRNPHATDCIAGGSSTGSGVAVATGLVPFAIGADGGGSIRIPSALNGVFGIKPTWGRVSRHGDSSTGSVAHLGPLASSTLDLARALEAMGPPDANDSQTDGAPPLPKGSLERALARGVKGLRIGVEEREWRDAARGVSKACEDAIHALERAGAKITPVQIPLARFAPAIGYVTIGLEALVALRAEWRDHGDEMSRDLQVSLAALQTLSGVDVVDAMRLRAGLRREAQRVFGEVDLLALPTTAATAMSVTDAEMETGFADTAALDALCRFAFFANLTGLPAGSCPVGKDARGLPIGFQLVGDAWDEATVLAGMAQLERLGAARAERPKVSVDVLVAR